MTSAFALAVSIAIFAVGCGGGSSAITSVQLPPDASQSDIDLFTRLADLHPQGANAFILPESDDFSRIPQDPKNPLTHEKVALGRLLFHETALLQFSARPEGKESASCATCHNARAGFQAGRFQGIGEGGLGFGAAGEARIPKPNYNEFARDTQPIRTSSALNSAYQRNHHYNGQFGASGANIGTESKWIPGSIIGTNNLGFEGVETQAIAGMGIHRLSINKILSDSLGYSPLFDAAFPTAPTATRYTTFNAGLAIAAYERTLLANKSAWQLYLRGDVKAMTESQKSGASLFFGKAKCFNCHTGAALNENNFRAVGFRDLYQRGDANNANATSIENFGRGGFTGNPADNHKFKTPQLYNLLDSSHYGHGSSIHSIREVIEYFNNAIPQNPNVPPSQLDPFFKPLGLNPNEIIQLTDFVANALRDPNLLRYQPDTVLSGNSIPNNGN
ncbi:MAG: cytochrome-c peroxidase [Fimbriimonadaceae bacterium]